jgi:nitrite reductase (NADH) large subunit
MEHVIIGNGVAAIGAVEGIREIDKVSPVTIISAEPYRVYGRPLIANLLSGKIVEADIYYRADDFYEARGVKLLLGEKAARIDVEKKRVVLESGKEVSFGRLLIATGGIPFIPPIKGGEGSGVYTFTTLDDAKDMEALPGKVERVVVIGGGLIGLKAAESLHDRGIKVTVVELADRILSSAFDCEAGEIVEKRLKEVGIEIVLENSVKEIVRAKGRIKAVILNNGERHECGAVVIAIGVIPSKAIVEGTGIMTNRGILTDGNMQTSVPGIYAAGDVAEAPDLLLGQKRVTPIWPNAYLQGRYAGLNMAGAKKSYRGGVAMNSIEFYGIPTVSMGISNPPDEGYVVRAVYEPKKNLYRKIVLKGHRLVGAVLVGQIQRAGVLSGLMTGRTNVESFEDELLNGEFGFAGMPPDVRKKILAENR